MKLIGIILLVFGLSKLAVLGSLNNEEITDQPFFEYINNIRLVLSIVILDGLFEITAGFYLAFIQ